MSVGLCCERYVRSLPPALREVAVFSWGGLKKRDWKTRDGQKCMVGKRGTKLQTGKRGKRRVWKAKRCTSHVVFKRISDRDEQKSGNSNTQILKNSSNSYSLIDMPNQYLNSTLLTLICGY